MLDLPHYFLYNDILICLSFCFVLFSLDAFFILQSYIDIAKRKKKKTILRLQKHIAIYLKKKKKRDT